MTFKGSLTVTHIGTATSIIDIDGIKFLTDPVFNGPSEYDMGVMVLKSIEGPAITIDNLPHIDAILLSHEDHPDNLDDLGRTLLNGRKVITTMDGCQKLQPRPDVRGIKPWETIKMNIQGKEFEITGTPCQHLPGGECTGFIITTESFGYNEQGLRNAVFFTGDTVYLDELKELKEVKKYHTVAAIMNLGVATAPFEQPLELTMGGRDASKLFKELEADVLIPIHFESWNHFKEHGEELAKAFEAEGLQHKVAWLTPGKAKKIF